MTKMIDFNLTGRLAEKTAKIDSEAKKNGTLGGRCVSRLANLATCLTALIDTISNLAVGILLTFTGVGLLIQLVNKLSKKEISSLTFTAGLKHIWQGVKLAPGVFFAPAVGVVSPLYLSEWYNGPQPESQKQAENPHPISNDRKDEGGILLTNQEIFQEEKLKTETKKPVEPETEKPVELETEKPVESQTEKHVEPETEKKETKVENPPVIKEIKEDQGKKIEEKWKYHDFEATEVVTRFDTVPLLKEFAQKELNYLATLDENLPYKGSTVGKRRAELANRMMQCDTIEVTRSWATSNYYRDLLRGRPELSPKHAFEERLQAFQKIMENEYIPLAINMRSHGCSILNGDTNSFIRIGIISDMSNGFTNLKELKQIREELKNGVNSKQTELKEFIVSTALKEKKNKQIDIAASYAYMQVENLEAVEKTIAKRKSHLEDQFLQLVMAHLEEGSSLGSLSSLSMIHVGLLNQDKKEIDDTGWFHNEANEMADMAEIFNDFYGKLLICDGSGPFVDQQGNIHLPYKLEDSSGKNKTLPIHAFFMNSSVQGHTGKDQTAKIINQETLEKLRNYTMERGNPQDLVTALNGIEKIVAKKNKTTYKTSVDLIKWSRKANFKISTGCLSAKDRTGYTCACDVVLNQMNGHIPKKAQRKFMNEQCSVRKPGVKVVKDNNPETNVMKIEPFFIPGVTDTPQGCIRRIGQLGYQGVEILRERKRIIEKLKEPQVST